MARKKQNAGTQRPRAFHSGTAPVPESPTAQDASFGDESMAMRAFDKDEASHEDLGALTEKEYFERVRANPPHHGVASEDVTEKYDGGLSAIETAEAVNDNDDDAPKSLDEDIESHAHAAKAVLDEAPAIQVSDVIRSRQNGTAPKPKVTATTDEEHSAPHASMLKGIIASRQSVANKITPSQEIKNRVTGRKSGSTVSSIIFERRYKK